MPQDLLGNAALIDFAIPITGRRNTPTSDMEVLTRALEKSSISPLYASFGQEQKHRQG